MMHFGGTTRHVIPTRLISLRLNTTPPPRCWATNRHDPPPPPLLPSCPPPPPQCLIQANPFLRMWPSVRHCKHSAFRREQEVLVSLFRRISPQLKSRKPHTALIHGPVSYEVQIEAGSSSTFQNAQYLTGNINSRSILEQRTPWLRPTMSGRLLPTHLNLDFNKQRINCKLHITTSSIL